MNYQPITKIILTDMHKNKIWQEKDTDSQEALQETCNNDSAGQKKEFKTSHHYQFKKYSSEYEEEETWM